MWPCFLIIPCNSFFGPRNTYRVMMSTTASTHAILSLSLPITLFYFLIHNHLPFHEWCTCLPLLHSALFCISVSTELVSSSHNFELQEEFFSCPPSFLSALLPSGLLYLNKTRPRDRIYTSVRFWDKLSRCQFLFHLHSFFIVSLSLP